MHNKTLSCFLIILMLLFSNNVFASDVIVEDILAQINGAENLLSLQQLIETNSSLLNIDVMQYNSLSTDYKQEVIKRICGNSYSSIESFRQEFNNAINEVSNLHSPIVFNDEYLEMAIRDIINKPEGDILKSDVESITELDLQDCCISNISGLEHFTNLMKLDLSYNFEIADITPLSSLSNLTELYLKYNNIKDISALKDLTNLTHLDLSYNEIYNICELPVLSYSSLKLEGNYLSIDENNEDMVKIQEIINCGGNVVYQYQKRPYTTKVVHFTQGTVSVNLVKHDDTYMPCKLIIAAYSLENRLLDMAIIPIDFDEPQDVDYTADIQNHVGGMIKTFIWNDQADMKPLSFVAEKELFEVAVVDYITTEKNEDDETCHKLYAFANGARIELTSINDQVLANIKNGDVIKYSVNQNGDIDQITLLYSLSNAVEGIYRRGREIIAYGAVDMRAGRVSIYTGTEASDFVFNSSEIEVYVYDTNQNNIRVGSVGDLAQYDYAFIRAVDSVIKEVIVVY